MHRVMPGLRGWPRPWIDWRIAVLGYSMGGESALSIVERGSKFAAAIAYYPWSRGHSAVVNAPTLILIGAEDNHAPAAFCREMVASPHEGGAAINLIVYPGAHHNFNFRVLTGPLCASKSAALERAA